MSQDFPNRMPTMGSFTGFDISTNNGVVDFLKSGWSIEELRRFLLDEGAQNFITREWAMLVNTIIQEHMADKNNPHDVTLDQITPYFVKNILGRVFPGNPPADEPFFSLDPANELPLGDMIPAAHVVTNALRLTNSRRFIPATGKLTTDFLTGTAGWPLFDTLTDGLNPDWADDQDLELNTTIFQTEHSTVSWPFPFWSAAENNTVSEFGVTLPCTTQNGSYHTTQFFIKGFVSGTITLYNKDDADAIAVFDLDTGTIISSDSSVKLVAIPQIENISLLCFSFLATGTSSTVYLIHKDPGQPNPEREGRSNRLLFMIAKPQVTKASGPAPLSNNGALPWSADPVYPDLSKFDVPNTLSEFIVNLSFYLQPNLGSSQLSTTLFKMGDLLFSRTAKQWQVKLSGVVLHTGTIAEGINVFTLSYEKKQIIIKSFDEERRVYRGNYPSLSTSNPQLGKCDGYLLGFHLYPRADRSQNVEFLTNA